MAGEVVAPAVRVLDYGWQAPNPIDYQRIGLASTEPMQRAVSEGVAAHNQFLLSQLNNARAMELAKWQHEAQIQREQIRYNRMIDVAKMRGEAAIKEIREKHDLNSLEKSTEFLRNQVGGAVPLRQLGESDADYKNRVDAAATTQIESNVVADAKAKVAIRTRRNQLNDYLTNNAPVFAQVSQMASQQTQDMAKSAAEKSFLTSHPEVAELMSQGAKDPKTGQVQPLNFVDAVKKSGMQQDFLDTFNGLHQAYQAQWLHQNAGVAGGVARSLAAVKSELQMLDTREKSLDLMSTPSGRMGSRPWASRSSNLADEMMLKATREKEQQKAAVLNPLLAPPVKPTAAAAPAAKAAGFNPADFDASGNPVNTAPFSFSPGKFGAAYYGPWSETIDPNGSGYDPSQTALDRAIFGPRTNVQGWSPEEIAKAESANPGFWDGIVHAPGYWARQVGSMFDSRVNPNNAFTPPADAVRYAPGVVPQRVNPVVAQAPVSAPVVAPVRTLVAPPVAPVAAPATTNMFTPPPAAAPLPQGATFAPGAGMFVPNYQPEVAGGSSDGLGDMLNMMRYQAAMSQP